MNCSTYVPVNLMQRASQFPRPTGRRLAHHGRQSGLQPFGTMSPARLPSARTHDTFHPAIEPDVKAIVEPSGDHELLDQIAAWTRRVTGPPSVLMTPICVL